MQDLAFGFVHKRSGNEINSDYDSVASENQPVGVKFKISDEHLRLFHMGVPPHPGRGVRSA